MKTLLPERDELSPALAPTFDSIEKELGFLPNFALMLGYSPNALHAYLQLSGSQAEGVFNAQEREAMLLAVSQFHRSPYCLAAHTEWAKGAGLSEADTVAARAGTFTDERMLFLTQFARAVAENRGQMPREMMDDFEEMGYDARALCDVIALVIEATFSNYVGLMTKVPVDFPDIPWVK